jgi:hypothetical protein
MRAFKAVCMCAAAITFVAHAEKNTYSVISLGPALPISSSAARVNSSGETKKFGTGWGAGWTFLGFPFAKYESTLSGLAFGGKISYNRWVRDSTLTQVFFLGTQAIVRYNLPPMIKPFNLFVQAGWGMFIGPRSFTSADTLDYNFQPSPLVPIDGMKKCGASFIAGMDWDVFEIAPEIVMVFTRGKPSAWFSINAAMKF